MTTVRFEKAIAKLYEAFHNNTLHPECCKQCAVGNICDATDAWKHLSDYHGSTQLNYVGLVHQRLGRRINGYTPQELLRVEATFLSACGFNIPLRGRSSKKGLTLSKEILFNGMVAVIELLCKFDAISNPMDYKAIFKNELERTKFTQMEI